jgi:hypothetical protein
MMLVRLNLANRHCLNSDSASGTCAKLNPVIPDLTILRSYSKMPHDDQFTAVGPSLTGSGFPRAGFSTDASDMNHGVNVRGEKCGVYGESDVPLPSMREPEIDGVGVHGFGTKFGVSGRATANGIAGVIGRHGNNGIGVIGAAKSEDEKGIGVVGISRSPGLGSPTAPVPDPADGVGIGVFGTSGKGAGMRGSSKSGEGGQFESQSGVGVRGTSKADGEGGYFESQSGVGVRGISRDNRGGSFTSGQSMAQIQLEPHLQTTEDPELPASGKVGDLVVIRSIWKDPEAGFYDFCSLWLCVPKAPFQEESDQWARVSLGGTVTGTL